MPPIVHRRDIWVVVAVILLALVIGILFPKTHGTVATVRMDGNITHTLSLATDTSLTLQNNGITLILAVQKSVVQVTHSDCPDGICKATAPIYAKGQTIVCLPAACSITVEGDSAVDAITY